MKLDKRNFYMNIKTNNDSLKDLTLGKKVIYTDKYDASLLQSVPRILGRKSLDIFDDKIDFHGDDIWNLYELSWLNTNGLPQVALGHMILNANSINLIESKSFKLYLNSFNNTKFTSWDEVRKTMEHDLSKCAQGEVEVRIYPLGSQPDNEICSFSGECIDNQNIKIERYDFDSEILKNSTSDEIVQETLFSDLLKSNCLITNQPDWASIQISYKGPKISREALLKYIISFRNHNEFHEQCVERIFFDIQKNCSPLELTVYARYTRRGGLDINPWRSNTFFTPVMTRLHRQ